MSPSKPCRKELLQWINVVSFAVNDTQLFLDTHPCNTEALAYFEMYQKERNAALQEYAACYGPLTVDTIDTCSCDCWNWINEPWPWQEGGC